MKAPVERGAPVPESARGPEGSGRPMKSVTVRLYGPLNDFLSPRLRHAALVCALEGSPSVKDFVESIGVPHVEIDVLVVNGQAVDFTYRVRGGDRIAAYPIFRAVDVGGASRLGPPPQAEPRFVADVHLGRLAAHYSRMSVFVETALASAAGDDGTRGSARRSGD